MMAIYGRPGEINCRPTSSLAMIELFSVDGSTRKHYSISYKQIDYEWTNSSLSSFSSVSSSSLSSSISDWNSIDFGFGSLIFFTDLDIPHY